MSYTIDEMDCSGTFSLYVYAQNGTQKVPLQSISSIVYDMQTEKLQRNLLRAVLRVDVQAADVRELRALLLPQTRHDRNLVVAFAELGHRHARHGRRRRRRHVKVRESREICLVGVGLQAHGKALRTPVVAHPRRAWSRPENVRDLVGIAAQRGNV